MYGFELVRLQVQERLHHAACDWHTRIASACPTFQSVMLQQRDRLRLGSMLDDESLHIMANADVIFCNNLCFDDFKRGASSINGRLGQRLQDLQPYLMLNGRHDAAAAKRLFVLSTSPLPCAAIKQHAQYKLPKGSVSWCSTEVSLYIGTVTGLPSTGSYSQQLQ